MDALRVDVLTRAIASTTRRGALGLLVSGVVALLEFERSGATHTGCRHHGKPCRRDIQCCSEKCSRKRGCKCPRDTTKCGQTECCDNATEQCCGGTCASATLVPEGGTCTSGLDSECCTGLTCTPNDLTCCRPEKICFKTCCAETERCTNDGLTGGQICCPSGKSCNGVCCRRSTDICTPGDLECCRSENVCFRSCCGSDEFCNKSTFNCEPIVIGP
jgi:hypothetical protein